MIPFPAPPAEKAKHGHRQAEHAFHSQPAAGTGVQLPPCAEGQKGVGSALSQ